MSEKQRRLAFSIPDTPLQTAVAQAGAIKPLIAMLSDIKREDNGKRISIKRNSVEIVNACTAVWNLATYNEGNQREIGELGGVKSLAKLSQKGATQEIRRTADGALKKLAEYNETKQQIAQYGALPVPVRMV